MIVYEKNKKLKLKHYIEMKERKIKIWRQRILTDHDAKWHRTPFWMLWHRNLCDIFIRFVFHALNLSIYFTTDLDIKPFNFCINYRYFQLVDYLFHIGFFSCSLKNVIWTNNFYTSVLEMLNGIISSPKVRLWNITKFVFYESFY